MIMDNRELCFASCREYSCNLAGVCQEKSETQTLHAKVASAELIDSRIVACVNACAEIENKELEAVSYAQLLESHQFLKRQVASADVLVEALRLAKVTFVANKWDVRNVMEVIDDALATYDKLSEVKHDTE